MQVSSRRQTPPACDHSTREPSTRLLPSDAGWKPASQCRAPRGGGPVWADVRVFETAKNTAPIRDNFNCAHPGATCRATPTPKHRHRAALDVRMLRLQREIQVTVCQQRHHDGHRSPSTHRARRGSAERGAWQGTGTPRWQGGSPKGRTDSVQGGHQRAGGHQ